MNKDPEMQGPTTQPNQNPQTTPVDNSAVVGQEVPLGPSDNLMVAEATLQTTQPDGTITETTLVPKKKKRIGLVAAIIAIVVLLIAGIGAGIWYFVYANSPEKIAYDAINGLFQEKALVTSATLTGETNEVGSENVRATIELQTKGEGAAASSELTISILPLDINGDTLYNKPPYRFTLSNIVLADGVFYIRTDDLSKSFDNFVTDTDISTEETAPIFELVSEIFTTIDGEWWRISVPELVDTFAEGGSEAEAAKDFYTCMVNVANQDIKGEIAKLYSDHRFINVAKSAEAASIEGNTLYDVSFDYDKMAGFVNASPDMPVAENIRGCYNHYLESTGRSDEKTSSEDRKTVTADELRQEFSTEDFTIQMQITDKEHHLTSISVKNEEQTASFNVNFTYGQTVEIQAPANYRPITDLYDGIIRIAMSIISSQLGGNYEYDPETGMIYDADDDFFNDDFFDDDFDFSLDDDDWNES